jgi:hypothetical protein
MTDADMLPHRGKKALREWWIDQAYDDYRRLRSAYYLMETRWPSAQFWHRRPRSE